MMNNYNQIFETDQQEQIEYLELAAEDQGYDSIDDLFADEPELFDLISAQYRN